MRELGAADHVLRQRRGRDVDIADGKTKQRIAHRAAGHPRLLAVRIEQRQHPCRRT